MFFLTKEGKLTNILMKCTKTEEFNFHYFVRLEILSPLFICFSQQNVLIGKINEKKSQTFTIPSLDTVFIFD